MESVSDNFLTVHTLKWNIQSSIFTYFRVIDRNHALSNGNLWMLVGEKFAQSGWFLFLRIVGAFAGSNHGIKLRNDESTVWDGPKVASSELIDVVTKHIIILFLPFGLVNWKLQLALNSSHEKVVNHNIIGWLVKFVSDPSQLKLSSHDLVVVKKI